jgi:hypothetical protein
MKRLQKFLVSGLIITAALFFSVSSSPTGGDDPPMVDRTVTEGNSSSEQVY